MSFAKESIEGKACETECKCKKTVPPIERKKASFDSQVHLASSPIKIASDFQTGFAWFVENHVYS
jgi:hypothetical protein